MSEEEVFVCYIPMHTTESNISVKIDLGIMLLRPANIFLVSGVCQYDIQRQRELGDRGLTMKACTIVPGTNWDMLLVVAAAPLSPGNQESRVRFMQARRFSSTLRTSTFSTRLMSSQPTAYFEISLQVSIKQS